MRIEKKIAGMRAFVQAARREGKSVGLVPTMGSLHEGHLALIRRSCNDNDVTVVSVFVNPTQFGPNEDFGAYPRDLERDAVLAQKQGVSVVFAPEAREMYCDDFSTWINVEQVSEGMCGDQRPGHFRGVATVVCKLLNIVQPDHAYFGEKDYQQLQVIRRMVRDLDIPVDVVPCPIVREADGLAMSSRNAYLSPAERAAAGKINVALAEAASLVAEGATGAQAIDVIDKRLRAETLLRPEYVVAVDPENLQDKCAEGKPLLLAVAVYAGKTRLIDNVRVE
ncbi:MAG: pantoate--beta-alanine ligase [Bacteroidota bacterium]